MSDTCIRSESYTTLQSAGVEPIFPGVAPQHHRTQRTPPSRAWNEQPRPRARVVPEVPDFYRIMDHAREHLEQMRVSRQRDWGQEYRHQKHSDASLETRGRELVAQWKSLLHDVLDRCQDDDSSVSLKLLDVIWADLSETERAIEAKYSLLLRCDTTNRERRALPDSWEKWFTRQVENEAILPSIAEAARDVLSEVVHRIIELTEDDVELSCASNGRALFEFRLENGHVQWLMNATSLPKSGVNILATVRRGVGDTAIRTYHRVSHAVDDLKGVADFR